MDQSSDEDDLTPVRWFEERPVPEAARFIVTRDVQVRHDSELPNETITTDPNELADDVPGSAEALPDVTPADHNSLNRFYDDQTAVDGEDLCEDTPPAAENVPKNVMDECVEERTLPDNHNPVNERDSSATEYPNIQEEQLPLPSDMSESDDEDKEDVIFERDTASKGRTDEKTSTDIPIRKSERIRQPSKRLDYPELGNPLVTVVKSLFQGLSTALLDSLEGRADNSVLSEHAMRRA